MRVLFVVGHPAHVHFFRNAICELKSRGHDVMIGAVRKETTTELLSIYGLQYVTLGVNVSNLVAKVLDMPRKDMRFIGFLHQTRPDIVLSVNSPYAAHACAVTSIPHIAFCDTEIATAIRLLTLPFSEAIVTPASYHGSLGPRHIRYRGYKELAYLRPSQFTPNPNVLRLIGASERDRLVVVRFGSWDSSHDLGEGRLRAARESRMIHLIHSLEGLGRVLLTSERDVPPPLRGYVLHVPLDQIHSILYYASLYFGEGATMASEAGVLGTPWIFLSPSGRGYLDDQQRRYGLGRWVTADEDALRLAADLLENPDVKVQWQARREKLLEDTVDVTNFIVNLTESWRREAFGQPMGSAAV